MIKKLLHFFDKLEDHTRHFLSLRPIIYAFVAGFAVVLFWRGVWMFMDTFDFMTPAVSVVISVIIMLLTGTLVSFFVGDEIIISGLKEEKRIDEKTEGEIKKEEARLEKLFFEITAIKKDLADIKKKIEKKK